VKLKFKIWMLLAALLGVVLAVDLTVSYQRFKAETLAELEYDAKTLYGLMMATRRVYQQVFIASGLPVNDRTIGFLPAHSFSRISDDFANWNQGGILFNTVSDRPRNPRNRADRFEISAMNHFRADPAATERLDSIVTDQGVGYMLFTAPIRIEPFCLKCHGDRAAAPPSIRDRYPEAYGYRVGELRGVVSIRIPTAKFDARVWRLWTSQLVKSLVGYAAVFLALGLILDRLVLGRLARLRQGAQSLAGGDYAARIPLPERSEDELCGLAAAFNRMAEEVQSRDQELSKLSLAVEQSPENIVITDLSGRIEYVNAAFVRNTGFSRDDLLGANPRLLQSGRTPPETYQALWATLGQGQVWQGEFINRRKDGAEYVESAIVAPVRNASGAVTHYLAVKQDITERKRAEAEIHNLAYFDPLTNLPNRRLLMDRLGQALVASQRSQAHGALLILDLDNFKYLNDTRGHDVGDGLLVAVAHRLVESVRHEDTVSRLGGDEYVLILENLSPDEVVAAHQAEMIGEKALAAARQSYSPAGSEFVYDPTASIGITLFRGADESVDDLLKQADLALYRAKDAGRNLLRFFNQSMQAAVNARAEMEHDLRLALSRQELSLYLQPQVDARGRVLGAEALLRWQRPDGSRVSPAEFIPLAEETGLILPIGDWVIRSACALLRSWATQPGLSHLQLAVNVSARQFHQEDFVARVAAGVADCRISASRLKLELTESVVLDNVEEVIQRMQALKALGIGFSLDDFGTGYSSLSYLKRLPLDQIKIDQSFVRDLNEVAGEGAHDDAIVRAILALSDSLALQVVAEGVETPAQLDYLRRAGCPAFQGYLFARPMPVADWPDWLARRASRDAEAAAPGSG
jgi:diguanylate cyclase (GGDEF)-like protein/PAS domain S-box-containing protein